MFIFSITAALLALISIGSAAFIFLKKKGPLNRYLGVYGLCIGVWVGSNAAADISVNDLAIRFWSGMSLIGGVFLVSFFLSFTEYFITEKTASMLKRAFFYIPSLFFSSIAFTRFYVIQTIVLPGAPAQIIPGNVNYAVILFCFGGLIFSVLRMIRAYKTSTAQKKKQIFFMISGFLALIFGGSYFTIILPLQNEFRFFTIGPQFSLITLALSAYAIFAPKLPDIRYVIQRCFAFLTLLTTVASIYLIIDMAVHFVTKNPSAITHLASVFTVCWISLFFAPKIDKYLQKYTDKYFFRSDYDYSEAMKQLNESLKKNLDISILMNECLGILQSALKPKTLGFILPEKDQTFCLEKKWEPVDLSFAHPVFQAIANQKKIIVRKHIPLLKEHYRDDEDYVAVLNSMEILGDKYDIELAVPLLVENKLICLLALDEKISGNDYTEKDFQLLETFSYQAASAIQKAELYKTVQDYSSNLEKKVDERTKEIKEMQENQRQMLYDISHQLQTPLTVIKGEIERLKTHCNYASNILLPLEDSANRVFDYVTQILRLARLEFRNDIPKSEMIDFSHAVKDMAEYFETLANQQSISIETVIEPNISLLGDKQRLEEMTANIVSNSIKYISGDRLIKISLHSEKDFAILRIKDTGIGISEEDLPHVFERFFRSNEKRNGTSNNLGLAICKRIVEAHNGEIDVHSVKNVGTTVTVKLPISYEN